MAEKNFFERRTDQSEVKARIVLKYVRAWARVVIPSAKKMQGKIAYIDLYSGPGRYRDGSPSTPLIVLQQAIGDPDLRQMLVTVFNDANEEHTSTLRSEIQNLPGVEQLRFAPKVTCGWVNEDAAKYFSETRLVPSFTFVDPFGYKGLTLAIVNGLVKDWGCDCIFFFNYRRINAAISNTNFDDHVNALFGKERANTLRAILPPKEPYEREAIILEALAQALRERGQRFVLPFRFKTASGACTSHSLVFVSKSFKGYEIMKNIMAGESSTEDQGVASLTYSPADASTPLLFSLSRPLDALKGMLLENFAGQSLRMDEVYLRHSVDTPYLAKNYKSVLLSLEAAGKITAVPAKRRKDTFADSVVVTFPPRKKK